MHFIINIKINKISLNLLNNILAYKTEGGVIIKMGPRYIDHNIFFLPLPT